MSVTRLALRNRMDVLMGEKATMPALTQTEKDDFIHEAHMAWRQSVPGFPGKATLSGTAFVNRIDFSAISSWGTGVPSVYVREVIVAQVASSTVLERVTLPEILELQNASGATGPAEKYALMHGDVKSVNNTTPEWSMFVYPTPSSSYSIDIYAEVYPWKFSADTDTIRLPDYDAWMVARIAAAMGAAAARRSPELIEELWSAVPERVQAVARTAGLTRRGTEVMT